MYPVWGRATGPGFARGVAGGCTVCCQLIAKQVVPAAYSDSGKEALALGNILVPVIAGVICFAILSFLTQLLVSITDAVYVCWATDCDMRTIAQPAVHAVFQAIPNIRTDALVQQPDGELGYTPG